MLQTDKASIDEQQQRHQGRLILTPSWRNVTDGWFAKSSLPNTGSYPGLPGSVQVLTARTRRGLRNLSLAEDAQGREGQYRGSSRSEGIQLGLDGAQFRSNEVRPPQGPK